LSATQKEAIINTAVAYLNGHEFRGYAALALRAPRPSRRQQQRNDLIAVYDYIEVLKDKLRDWADLSALKADQEVAEHLGVEVETLNRWRTRARSYMPSYMSEARSNKRQV
jgi:hypothetical protein